MLLPFRVPFAMPLGSRGFGNEAWGYACCCHSGLLIGQGCDGAGPWGVRTVTPPTNTTYACVRADGAVPLSTPFVLKVLWEKWAGRGRGVTFTLRYRLALVVRNAGLADRPAVTTMFDILRLDRVRVHRHMPGHLTDKLTVVRAALPIVRFRIRGHDGRIRGNGLTVKPR